MYIMGILSEFAAECEHTLRQFRRSKSTRLFFGAATLAGLVTTTVGIVGALYTSSFYLCATILVIGACITICPVGIVFILGMYLLAKAFVKG